MGDRYRDMLSVRELREPVRPGDLFFNGEDFYLIVSDVHRVGTGSGSYVLAMSSAVMFPRVVGNVHQNFGVLVGDWVKGSVRKVE